MNRRAFLTTATTLTASALTGCLKTNSPTDAIADTTIIRKQVNTERFFAPNTEFEADQDTYIKDPINENILAITITLNAETTVALQQPISQSEQNPRSVTHKTSDDWYQIARPAREDMYDLTYPATVTLQTLPYPQTPYIPRDTIHNYTIEDGASRNIVGFRPGDLLQLVILDTDTPTVIEEFTY